MKYFHSPESLTEQSPREIAKALSGWLLLPFTSFSGPPRANRITCLSQVPHAPSAPHVSILPVFNFWELLLFHFPVVSFLFQTQIQSPPPGSHPCLLPSPPAPPDSWSFCLPWMTELIEDRVCVCEVCSPEGLGMADTQKIFNKW